MHYTYIRLPQNTLNNITIMRNNCELICDEDKEQGQDGQKLETK